MNRGALAILLILLSAVLSEAHELNVDPDSMEILVGTRGVYILTLNTDYTGEAFLNWTSPDGNKLWAGIEDNPSGPEGSYPFTSNGRQQTFYLYVEPQSGITTGVTYDIVVSYSKSTSPAIVRASASASIIPVPELASSVLMSVGLIGLVGLSRMRRKDRDIIN